MRKWELCRIMAVSLPLSNVRMCSSVATQKEKKISATPYKRHSSNPETLREKAAFRRDHKYGRYKPLPDAPWRRLKKKSYLDDAERLYGRKETWSSIKDDALREKLVAILQDYLRDTLSAARLETREAKKYRSLCVLGAREYRAYLNAGAFSSPDIFTDWIKKFSDNSKAVLGHRLGDEVGDQEDSKLGRESMEEDHDDTPHTREEEELEAFKAERRLRGENADLTDTTALSGVSSSDLKHRPREAFPFLRQRAVENEDTLDPSLVDWTAKYFPEDTKQTFAHPPKIRSSPESTETETQTDGSPSSPRKLTPRSTIHARQKLNRSLRKHDDHYRATFDADGVFFHMKKPSASDDENELTTRPRSVKGSELDAMLRKKREVVKVPWDVAAKAQEQGYTTDILRSKEQLIRLSRGEDPHTIP